MTGGDRVTHLLRQVTAAIATPHQVGPDLWHGDEEALTMMSVWSLLESLAAVVEAAHLTNDELRHTCGEPHQPLVIATAF